MVRKTESVTPNYLKSATQDAKDIQFYAEQLSRFCNSASFYYNKDGYTNEQIEDMKQNACTYCEFIIDLANNIIDTYNQNPVSKSKRKDKPVIVDFNR